MVGIGFLAGFVAKAKGWNYTEILEGSLILGLVVGVLAMVLVIAGVGAGLLIPSLGTWISGTTTPVLIIFALLGGFIGTIIGAMIGGAFWDLFEYGKKQIKF